MSDGLNRRDFLKVVGVASVATTAAACGAEQNVKLVPYVVPPEGVTVGVPVFYASTCRECPVGCGVHVKTREGRPIKIEGNPDHPVNQGKLCVRGQASLQGLYNPDRVKSPLRKEGGTFKAVSWDEALALVTEKIKGGENPEGVWLLTPTLTGSMDALCGEWLGAIGSPNRVIHEPFAHDALREGNRLSLGNAEIPQYDLAKAQYIISFGADFLDTWLSPVELTRGFTKAHGYADGQMARFVSVEPWLSPTGTSADEWVAPVPGTELLVALSMAHVIVKSGKARNNAAGLDLGRFAPDQIAETTGVSAGTIERLADEFATHSPSVALPGGAALQNKNAAAFVAAVNVLNYVAGNVGQTVLFGPNADTGSVAGGAAAMTGLIDAMNAGKVETLVVLDTNPAYSLPKSYGFSEALGKVPFKVAITQFMDETAEQCDLVLADHSPLESWGDWSPRSGVLGLQQPTIQPLYDTRQAADVLIQTANMIGGGPKIEGENAQGYLKNRWKAIHALSGSGELFELWWRGALVKGGLWHDVSGQGATLGNLSGVNFETPALEGEGLVLVAYPGTTYDGRGANKPWLQELPDPIAKTVWSTPVFIHPESAVQKGIAMADMVEISTASGTIEATAFVTPGIRRDTIAVPFGEGHTAYGRWAKGTGGNAFDLIPAVHDAASGAPAYLSTRARVVSKGPAEHDVRIQLSQDQDGRGIVQTTTLAAMLGHGEEHGEHGGHEAPAGTTIPVEEWPEHDAVSEDYRWGMAIDLGRCTGCNACVVACSAENNVPMIGASKGTLGGLKNFAQGRIMNWIRIERYYEEDSSGNVRADQIPMLCQQCGAAPCEPVCPVFAAYHSDEGLNGQVYNRCVGTRYCSNNCPYKVRRFNYWHYVWEEPLHLQLNPDVTVRSKGVMEKCTFCIQRIQVARSKAKDEGRKIQDGDVTPACVQTCPANAIVFGNLKDRESQVSKQHRDPRNYYVLESLNTRPSIAYLKRVRSESHEA